MRLWAHECERTFADRMVDDADIMSYHDIATTVTRQYFGEALDVVQGRTGTGFGLGWVFQIWWPTLGKTLDPNEVFWCPFPPQLSPPSC